MFGLTVDIIGYEGYIEIRDQEKERQKKKRTMLTCRKKKKIEKLRILENQLNMCDTVADKVQLYLDTSMKRKKKNKVCV